MKIYIYYQNLKLKFKNHWYSHLQIYSIFWNIHNDLWNSKSLCRVNETSSIILQLELLMAINQHLAASVRVAYSRRRRHRVISNEIILDRVTSITKIIHISRMHENLVCMLAQHACVHCSRWFRHALLQQPCMGVGFASGFRVTYATAASPFASFYMLQSS